MNFKNIYKKKYLKYDLNENSNPSLDTLYKTKYLKYKNKYLNLKEKIGGHYVESSNLNESIYPFENINATYALNGHVILLNPENELAYNIKDDNFIFSKIDKTTLDLEQYKFSDLYRYSDYEIDLGNNIKFDFNFFLFDDLFDIFENFYDYCINNIILSNEEKNFTRKMFKKIFSITKENQLIKLSGAYNILFKFMFVEKFKELLSFIYENSQKPQKLLEVTLKLLEDNETYAKLEQRLSNLPKIVEGSELKDIKKLIKTIKKFLRETLNDYINISKFFDQTSLNQPELKEKDLKRTAFRVCDKTEDDNDKLGYLYFRKDGIELINFMLLINIMNKIPFYSLTYFEKINKIELNYTEEFKKYSTSLIFFGIFFSQKLKQPLSSLGAPRNKLYSINLKYQLLSLGIDIGIKKENIYINKITENLNDKLPQLYDYYQMDYNGKKYPDCVENTLLQFLKILSWNGSRFDISLVPSLSTDFKIFLDELNRNIPNTNLISIKNRFSNMVSNIDDLVKENIYKNEIGGKFVYEIKSTPQNFLKILSYIYDNDFSNIIDEIDIKSQFTLNPNIQSIILNKTSNMYTFKIQLEKTQINIIIQFGHSFFRNISRTNIWSFEKDTVNYKLKNYKYFPFFIFLNKNKEYINNENKIHSLKYKIVKNIPWFLYNYIFSKFNWETFFDMGNFYSQEEKDTLIRLIPYVVSLDKANSENIEYDNKLDNILNSSKYLFLSHPYILNTLEYYIQTKIWENIKFDMNQIFESIIIGLFPIKQSIIDNSYIFDTNYNLSDERYTNESGEFLIEIIKFKNSLSEDEKKIFLDLLKQRCENNSFEILTDLSILTNKYIEIFSS
jgi:hypothetical protein